MNSFKILVVWSSLIVMSSVQGGIVHPPLKIAQKESKNHQGKINVKKVYVHDGNFSRKVILHFSKEPVVTYTPESVNEKERDAQGLLKMHFFIPLACINETVNKEALEALSGMHSSDYGLSFSEVSKPMQGIKCLIAFNPDKIGFEYKTFQSITGDSGIIFQFYHQNVLRKMSENNNIRMHASANIFKKSKIGDLKKK